MARRSRTILAYVMHGHLDSAQLDYAHFFRWVYETPPRATQMSLRQDLDVVIERMSFRGPFLDLRLASGNPNSSPLYYSETTGETTRTPLPPGTWAAQQTRVTIMPEERLVFIEGRQNGVSAATLEQYLTTLARINRYASRMKLSLNRLPSSSFEEEVERLTRIRKASLEVNRPNTDWDEANDMLSTLAGESDGQQAQVVVSAAHGASLSRTDGIVKLIFTHVRRTLTNVREAKVVGRRPGAKRDTIISTEKHQVQAYALVDDRSPDFDQDEIIFAEAHRLADATVLRLRSAIPPPSDGGGSNPESS